ncbi:NUDIX domain-containing protein [Amycolatopsis benzoatilytica]|uniref:NUDIX domain-containing protein n=1 Tax=Amycolatopsis benzoatilytica TaxID=346045 RepID=UPI0006848743|nr:NUDIX domain-containing protein [Amycolatopsis benzoatilytica]
MAVRRSAGLLLFRRSSDRPEVLLAHMGGPFWAKKDEAAWSLPKGELDEGEDAEAAARREFAEELGLPVPDGRLRPLGEVRQSGKVVAAWAVEADLDPATVVPGTFDLEWPPRSGKVQQFPEVDRVEWFDLDTAREKLVKGQRAFLDRFAELELDEADLDAGAGAATQVREGPVEGI